MRPPRAAGAPIAEVPGTATATDTYRVDVSADLEPFLARCAALGDRTASPFHSPAWLRHWYAAFGASAGARPVLVGVRSQRSGADVMLLPLASRRVAGASVVEFADAGVVDYQLPLVSPHWHNTPEEARRLWRAVRQALAAHDVLRIDKMLGRSLDEAGAAPNPLLHVLRPVACEMFGNQMHAPGTWEAWRQTLPKRVRSEFGRFWRVFTRSPQARFERLTDPHEALLVFEQLEAQQARRLQGRAAHYALDQPAHRAFYRAALMAGLADGSVVLTALRDGPQLVAGLYGVANAERYIALRLSTVDDERWASCSPGKLLLERTANHLHAQGLLWFDLGIGAYAHKAVFGVSAIPLHDAIQALSWRGWPMVWGWHVRRMLKRQAWLVRVVRRFSKHDGVHAAG